ncbi:uncharacterized protein E0L32_009462 [Thyridium curvatum]|uniref:Uncharacterized protein n=1 Tax=Thyridium curvatum TaxID=1093900 RepID=A0A507AYE0_9PEZI|nr:uncharacterized protein E0L32_009462 [Thyridium curvatum]TPX09270.1 hypothetical protein E0L32_009462 [Thyridium curvatum]
MKGRPVADLVFEYMFPRRKPSDPPNFPAVLTRYLIYEVRQEVQAFYGHIDTHEAKYPGLDYCHPTHRVRLSRWPWHRRLFRAFDALRLTPSEIAGLTKWEGTRWAKERFEKEQGFAIRDTGADGIPPWVAPEQRPVSQSPREQTDETEAQDGDGDEAMDEPYESDEELESIGVELNQRLRERVAAHNAGDTSQPLDEDWEQWLKYAMETGEFPLVADQIAQLSQRDAPMSPEEIFPPRIVEAARNGQWHEVPDFLHDMLRRSLDTELHQQLRQQQPSAPSASGSSSRPAQPSPLSQQHTPRTRWAQYSGRRLAQAGPDDVLAPRAAEAPGA